jgi:UDP-N-acetylglucosamine--N-acetylmuramyl-(pentapeptide) pyrophosphoryl-undecaprenol N-acetylglucosamine transferase
VFGGSLGATSINNAIERILSDLMKLNLQLIWQTGHGDFERIEESVRQQLEQTTRRRVSVMRFIERMEFAYAAADFAVCRAGASTLAELTCVGLPSILVPYPFAAADHQTENARAMVEANAAMTITDSMLMEKLLSTIRELNADEARLKLMSVRARSLGRPEAASTIAQSVLALAGG